MLHITSIYADDVNIERTPHTLKKTQKLVASKVTDKAKYMVMSQGQNARRIHIIKIDNNSSFERVEHSRYIGITLTNENFIQKEIRAD
jgi:ribosomal protein S2